MSRNTRPDRYYHDTIVTSREGRVSRNLELLRVWAMFMVTSREGRVSRNAGYPSVIKLDTSHVPREACE